MIIGVMLGGAVGYLIGLNVAAFDISAAKELVQQVRTDNQKLKIEVIDQNARQVALQTKLTGVETTLKAIVPTNDTYVIMPNQSLIVADGRLTLGLIGSPSNESVNININGLRQSAAPGDIINVAVDPPTTCQVRVQSFDMFKAVLSVMCGAARSQ
ncbi:MAG: hypothetical protein WBG10_07295 [Pseudolabrys sp.]